MWISGATASGTHKNVRETGLLEEIIMENYYRTTNLRFTVWDSVLYGIVRNEPNITLLLNCTCQQAEMDGDTIKTVTGWQLTTQCYHTVEAKFFADCSGDSILAPLTGAEFMRCLLYTSSVGVSKLWDCSTTTSQSSSAVAEITGTCSVP